VWITEDDGTLTQGVLVARARRATAVEGSRVWITDDDGTLTDGVLVATSRVERSGLA
jgi:hypothetical protein